MSHPSLVRATQVAPPFSNIDHLPLIISLSLQTTFERQNPTVTIWDYPKTNTDGLIAELSRTDWESITNENIDEAVESLTKTILHVAKLHIPTKTIKIRNNKPWFSAELRREMRKRDRLFKLAQRNNTEIDWTRWRTQRNLVTNLTKSQAQERNHTK